MMHPVQRHAYRNLIALLILACAGATCRANEPQPIGYVVDTVLVSDEDDVAENAGEVADEPANIAYLVRNGEKLAAVEGTEVFSGDVLSTDPDSTIGIAFLDNSAVTVRPGSTVRIVDYAYPARRTPTYVSVEAGRAYFSVSPRPDDSHFFVQMDTGVVEVKGTKFEVFHTKDSNGYTTTVAVTKGTVTLKPKNSNTMDIYSGTQMVMTVVSQNFANFTSGDTTINQKNLTKSEIKVLEAIAISDIEVTVSKKGKVKIKSVNKNIDGTKTYIKMTEFQNKVVKITTVITNSLGKVISVVSESKSGTKSKETDGSLYIKSVLKAGQTLGKVTIKDKDTKVRYKGVLTMLADGTQVEDAKSKNGARIVMTEKVNADGSVTKTVVKFAPNATQGTQLTKIISKNGATNSYIEIVSSTLLANGDFATISGSFSAGATAPLPPGAPHVYTTTTTVLVPDTTSVSP